MINETDFNYEFMVLKIKAHNFSQQDDWSIFLLFVKCPKQRFNWVQVCFDHDALWLHLGDKRSVSKNTSEKFMAHWVSFCWNQYFHEYPRCLLVIREKWWEEVEMRILNRYSSWQWRIIQPHFSFIQQTIVILLRWFLLSSAWLLITSQQSKLSTIGFKLWGALESVKNILNLWPLCVDFRWTYFLSPITCCRFVTKHARFPRFTCWL